MKSPFASVAACVAVCALLSSAAVANDRPLPLSPTYTTPPPAGYKFGGPAFDGDWMAVPAGAFTDTSEGPWQTTAAVFLYRRSGLGPWVLQSKLLEFPFDSLGTSTGLSLAMENGLLAIDFQGKLYIYERSSSGYTQSGVLDDGYDSLSLRIDGKRILAGLGNCDGAAVVEKSAAGTWAISGRLVTTGDDCGGETHYTDDLDFSGDYALVATRNQGNPTQAFRRGPTGWAKTAEITGLNDHFASTAVALRGNLAMLSGNLGDGTRIFRRVDATGTSWDPVGALQPVDNFVGWTGHVGSIRQRNELWAVGPDLWRQNPDSSFQYLARLGGYGADANGRTAVGHQLDGSIATYILPEIFPATPASLRDDFQGAGNIDWQLGYGFTHAQSGFTRVLRQTQASSISEANITNDWSSQSIQADVRPTGLAGAYSFVGLTARRVDAGNYYQARFLPNRVTLVKRTHGGSDVQLASAAMPFAVARTYRLRFEAVGSQLRVFVDGAQMLDVADTDLTHGGAGLASYATADFDNVVVSALASPLFEPGDMYDAEKWTSSGGTWVDSNYGSTPFKHSQIDRTVAARSLTGVRDTDDQVVDSVVRIDSLPPSGDRWVGVLARYRDNANLYYASLRVGSGVQIRRVVNGTATVLATAPYTVKGNVDYRLRFEVVGDELRVFVNDVFLAEAHDAALATGRFGVATNLAAASFSSFNAFQP